MFDVEIKNAHLWSCLFRAQLVEAPSVVARGIVEKSFVRHKKLKLPKNSIVFSISSTRLDNDTKKGYHYMRYTVGKTKKQKSLVLSLLNPTMVGRYRYKVLENVGGG